MQSYVPCSTFSCPPSVLCAVCVCVCVCVCVALQHVPISAGCVAVLYRNGVPGRCRGGRAGQANHARIAGEVPTITFSHTAWRLQRSFHAHLAMWKAACADR